MGPNYFINSGKPNIFYKHLEHVFNHKSNRLNSPHSPNYEMQKYKRKKNEEQLEKIYIFKARTNTVKLKQNRY